MAGPEGEEKEEAEGTTLARSFRGGPLGPDLESLLVMAGLVPAIHVFQHSKKDVDARVKPAHDA